MRQKDIIIAYFYTISGIVPTKPHNMQNAPDRQLNSFVFYNIVWNTIINYRIPIALSRHYI